MISPESIAIGIITCRRPDGLRKLLDSLLPIPSMIILVDNDPARSAEAVAADYQDRLRLLYAHEPEPGIPFARNRCLRLAVEGGYSWLAFLDDDEWVAPDWLEQLRLAQDKSGAEIVTGPVYPVFEREPPAWMKEGGFYDRQRHADGTVLQAAASNNVLFSLTLVTEDGLRFNEGMRHTGGTDHLFFSAAARLGRRIVWAAQAGVWEDVPASRLTVDWLCRRYFRFGNTHTLTERILHPGLLGWLKLAAQGNLRLLLGMLAWPLIPLVGPIRAMKIRRAFYRGAGMLAALASWQYQEYKPTVIARNERSE